MKYLLLLALIIPFAGQTFSQNTIENEVPVDVEAFFKKLSGLQINTWNLKGQEVRNYGLSDSELVKLFGTDSKGKTHVEESISNENKIGLNFTAVCVLAQTIQNLTVENGTLKEEIRALQNNLIQLQTIQTDVMDLMQNNSKIQEMESKVLELSTQLMDLKQEFKMFKEEAGRR